MIRRVQREFPFILSFNMTKGGYNATPNMTKGVLSYTQSAAIALQPTIIGKYSIGIFTGVNTIIYHDTIFIMKGKPMMLDFNT